MAIPAVVRVRRDYTWVAGTASAMQCPVTTSKFGVRALFGEIRGQSTFWSTIFKQILCRSPCLRPIIGI